VLDEVVKAAIEDEYFSLMDIIMKQDIFASEIQFVFALLTKSTFAFYGDMHMN
jgi:hypothetical protein